jgi:hypothetical protein
MENIMKNLIKLFAIGSVLIIAAFLISSCGSGGTENFVQGNGQINVTAENSTGAIVFPNVRIDVHKGSPTGTIIDTAVSDVNGAHVFQETVGSDYYFTFTDLTTPARFASPQNWPTKVTPLLTATQNLTVQLI